MDSVAGYVAMVVKAYDYDTRGAPQSWAKIIAMRHAISLYPDARFIWYLHQDAFIMDPTKSLDGLVTDSKKLESLMIRDYPVVPPDSIIKTFSHMRGQDANLIISQDNEGLVSDSMIIRNGDWAKFFIDTWLDPLYRSYNFQKAERHALVSDWIICDFRSIYINLLCRNTWYSGTLRSFRRWLSCSSNYFPPTPETN